MTDLGDPVERVILWGFMASGKSAVGAALARRIGWSHVDLDSEIERLDGRPIARIFAEEGEPAFRRLEMQTTRELIGRREVVISVGGGWVTNSEAIDLVPQGSITVWLQVSPEVALARAVVDGGGSRRPLLAGEDPRGTVRRLMQEREHLYKRADVVIETDERDAETLAMEIETQLRDRSMPDPHSSGQTDHGEG